MISFRRRFRREARAIFVSSIQTAFFLAIAAYLCFARAALELRNNRPWDAIAQRLQGNAGSGIPIVAAEMDRRFTAHAIAQRARDVRGRCRMFHEAGAMMEMADYMQRNGGMENALIAANLRGHAIAIRIETVKDFVLFPVRSRAK